MNNEIRSIYDLPIGSQREHNGLLLTLTEDGWRAEVQHSMMRRCKGWDYCRPWIYLVTIGCQHHDEAPMPQAIPVKCSQVSIIEKVVVPISPCISPGERVVARAVMDEGYNLIALFPQGIPEDIAYKPYREYFDACASGQLLLMSPWRFENGVKHLARWQCLFLNDIAMQLMTETALAA